MSTASRTACTSWGVSWVFWNAMELQGGARLLRALWPAQLHHGGAVASLVVGAGAHRGHGGMRAQVAADGLPQTAGAMAVHHPHLGARGEQRPVEVGVELDQRRLDALADEVDLGRHRDRLLEVAPTSG